MDTLASPIAPVVAAPAKRRWRSGSFHNRSDTITRPIFAYASSVEPAIRASAYALTIRPSIVWYPPGKSWAGEMQPKRHGYRRLSGGAPRRHRGIKISTYSYLCISCGGAGRWDMW